MKLEYKPVGSFENNSVYVKRVKEPYNGRNWHFHKEFELIYFLKGHGIRVVGDHISNFKNEELVLVGGWLPHLWHNDTNGSDQDDVDFVVIKFPKEFNGINIFALPEFSNIRNLLDKSRRGVLFSSEVEIKIRETILSLSKARSSEKVIEFLRVLEYLSNEDHYKLLCSAGYSLPKEVSGENRLQKVINYIFNNYAQNITLDDISEIAIMTPTAFCRFFKMQTNKTFSHFLNEVRVSKACQLLVSRDKSIKQICYAVGFNSLTNFNRTFRAFKGKTPSEYKTNYRVLHQ
jgi:AraC-like DNA-binding protein